VEANDGAINGPVSAATITGWESPQWGIKSGSAAKVGYGFQCGPVLPTIRAVLGQSLSSHRSSAAFQRRWSDVQAAQ
jgi:hypothetical protein